MPKISELNILDEPFRGLIYGNYNTGKSVFAASFPTPGKVFDLDKGAITYKDSGGDWDGEQYYIGASPSATWARMHKDILEFKKEVLSPENKYKTCVFDSTTMMKEFAMAVALEKFPLPLGKKPDRYIHYPIVASLISGLLIMLKELPINLVVIGHVIEGKDEETKKDYVYPAVPGQLRTILPAMFGEVWFAKTKKMAGGKIEYMLQTRREGLYDARSRLSGINNRLPLYVPNDYTKVMEIINKSIEGK